MSYHCSIATGHFARKLAAAAQGKRGQYQPVAVLGQLWLLADPHAQSPIVRVSFARLRGFVSSEVVLRQVIAKLKKVGALTRRDGMYQLIKPAVDELDEFAQSQLADVQALQSESDRLNGPALTPKPAHERVVLPDKQEVNAALQRLNKERSDVRDVLAKMAGIKPNALTYSGQGSMQVQHAINWLASTGSTWRVFVQVCARAHADQSSDRPKNVTYLFEPSKRAYLNRMLAADSEQKPAPKTPKRDDELEVSDLEELEDFEALLDDFAAAPPNQRAAMDKHGVWQQALDKHRPTALQDSSPTTAT